MARGVSRDFLHVLDQDARTGSRHIWLSATFLLLVIGASLWFHPLAAAIAGAAIIVGAIIGHRIAWRRNGRHESALVDGWMPWMKAASAHQHVDGVAAADAGRRVRPGRAEWIIGWLAFWIIETLLILIAETAPQGLAEAAPFAIINGLFAGSVLAAVRARRAWARAMRASLDDMVATGEIGIWGHA